MSNIPTTSEIRGAATYELSRRTGKTLDRAQEDVDRWLANHDAEVRALALEAAAVEWQRGAWSNDMPPKEASRVQIITRMSQWATDWLRHKADQARREIR